MNYYYIKHFASLRGKKSSDIGRILTDSSNPVTRRSIIYSCLNYFRYISKDKIDLIAQELKVSPEWFYFAPMMFSARDFIDIWQDYLQRKSVPLIEQGNKGYEFVIGENEHLAPWFDEYFEMKTKYLNKEISRERWYNWAFLCLKKMPDDVSYENASDEVIRRYMRLHNLEVPFVSNSICEALYDNPDKRTKSRFLRAFKTDLDTHNVPKRILLSFSELSTIEPDVCFSQFYLDSPESLFNFFVATDIMLSPIYYLKAYSDDDPYRKRLVLYDPAFKVLDKSEDTTDV